MRMRPHVFLLPLAFGAALAVAGEPAPLRVPGDVRHTPMQQPGTTLLSALPAIPVLSAEYPNAARGDIVVRVALDHDGSVRTIELVEHSGKPQIDDTVVTALRGWRFGTTGGDRGFLRLHVADR